MSCYRPTAIDILLFVVLRLSCTPTTWLLCPPFQTTTRTTTTMKRTWPVVVAWFVDPSAQPGSRQIVYAFRRCLAYYYKAAAEWQPTDWFTFHPSMNLPAVCRSRPTHKCGGALLWLLTIIIHKHKVPQQLQPSHNVLLLFAANRERRCADSRESLRELLFTR